MRLIGRANEVSEGVESEESLRAHEELRTILDSVPAFIWYKDRDNRILRANRAAAESMGTTAKALEGRSTYEVYPEEAAKYHRDDLEVIRSGRPKLGIVEPLLMATGEKRWIRTDKIPYRDQHGEIIGVIVFAVEITDRIRAEEALQRARDSLEARVAERTAELASAVENLQSEIAERQSAEERALQHQATLAHVLRLHTVEGMTAELAHEINQPLAAIANFANGLAARLRDGATDAKGMREAAEEISRQALRAGRVIRRLRDFVRKDRTGRERCDLVRVIREAVLLMAVDARRLRVVIHVDIDQRLPAVAADPIQIEQVIMNLLKNGLEAISVSRKAKREIRIETGCTDGKVEVRVHDSGKGLSARTAKRVFEPFYTTKRAGLGMGLSISRSIIEAHRGELLAVRNRDGGATFTFTLPVARARAARKRAGQGRRAPTRS